MKTWAEKCKDPRWQKLRLKVLQRDNWACSECGDQDETLVVHHVSYYEDFHNPWDYNENELLTLCQICHDEAHRRPIFLPNSVHQLYGKRIKTLCNDDFDRFFDMSLGSLDAAWGPLV